MPKGYMYILECSNGSYYVGSTIDLEKRFLQHSNGEGSKHTKKYLQRFIYIMFLLNPCAQAIL